jgi:hypothetical protein
MCAIAQEIPWSPVDRPGFLLIAEVAMDTAKDIVDIMFKLRAEAYSIWT